MMLLTKENRKALPPLHGTDPEGGKDIDGGKWVVPPDQVKAVVKFFTPDSSWTWYAIEFDGNDEFFGLVDGHYKELGYFRLSELEAIRGPFGMKVERDMHFTPTTAKSLGSKGHGG
jgi:hypothetical protein